MKFILIILGSFFLISCKSDSQHQLDEQYDNFIKDTSGIYHSQLHANYVSENHYDFKKRKIANEWLRRQEYLLNPPTQAIEIKPIDSAMFLNRNIKIIATLETFERCNLVRKYFLIKQLSASRDSLEICTSLILDSIFKTVSVQDCGAILPRCAVYLYKSKKDYDRISWTSMGTRNTGLAPSITLRND